ncbi:FlgO domain-containing protein [Gammaproteobacteria bacterium]
MKRTVFVLAVAAIVTSLEGCATFNAPEKIDVIGINYAATEALLKSSTWEINPDQPIIVATMVNIDQLTESSRIGRMISEQVSAWLTKAGHSVIELKLRGNIFVKQSEGELALSREIKDITTSHNAQAIVVGTYAESRDTLYVNLKIVGVDNQVLAAHDYSIPIDASLRPMLYQNCRGNSGCRY